MSVSGIDWKKEVAEELKKYPLSKALLNMIEIKRTEIENQKRILESAPDESKLAELSVKETDLTLLYLEHSTRVNCIDRSFEVLREDERQILIQMYMVSERPPIHEICERTRHSKTDLYRRKDKALRKLVIMLYGVSFDWQ